MRSPKRPRALNSFFGYPSRICHIQAEDRPSSAVDLHLGLADFHRRRRPRLHSARLRSQLFGTGNESSASVFKLCKMRLSLIFPNCAIFGCHSLFPAVAKVGCHSFFQWQSLLVTQFSQLCEVRLSLVFPNRAILSGRISV